MRFGIQSKFQKNGRRLLVKIPKKGDLSSCENWRGITLLCAASKILTTVMLERMKAAADKKLRGN
jgi:hypothetical protein